MNYLLFFYQRPEPATWVLLSSFLLLSIYFVFQRFFSIRNLDVVLLLLLSPGLLMVYEGRKIRFDEPSNLSDQQLVSSNPPQSTANRFYWIAKQQAEGTDSDKILPSPAQYEPAVEAKTLLDADSLEFYGFVALLFACALLTIRMLIDPALVRRPMLVPNLNIGGLSFIGVCLFLFLMSIVVTSTPHEQEVRGPQLGPGYAFLNMLPQLPTTPEVSPDLLEIQPLESSRRTRWLPNIARFLAVVSNLVIVVSIIGIGYWHFDNTKTGIGCAVMYLLLPYTAQMAGNLEHAMPAAFMTLALLAYRQPLIAGCLMGLAAGLVYYPLFLLPLWISFYWKRGLSHWVIGVCASLVLLVGLLLLQGWQEFLDHLRVMFGVWLPRMDGLKGIWGPGGIQADYRLPVLVGFILLSGSYAIWPSRKNLGTLMSGTAVVMLAAQFWHGFGGGLFMAWFLPFVLLTIFRPNVDDRVAATVVRTGRRLSLSRRNRTVA
jgi:hypothetical protein